MFATSPKTCVSGMAFPNIAPKSVESGGRGFFGFIVFRNFDRHYLTSNTEPELGYFLPHAFIPTSLQFSVTFNFSVQHISVIIYKCGAISGFVNIDVPIRTTLSAVLGLLCCTPGQHDPESCFQSPMIECGDSRA